MIPMVRPIGIMLIFVGLTSLSQDLSLVLKTCHTCLLQVVPRKLYKFKSDELAMASRCPSCHDQIQLARPWSRRHPYNKCGVRIWIDWKRPLATSKQSVSPCIGATVDRSGVVVHDNCLLKGEIYGKEAQELAKVAGSKKRKAGGDDEMGGIETHQH